MLAHVDLDQALRILKIDVRQWKVPVVGWYSPPSLRSGDDERYDHGVLASPNAEAIAPATNVEPSGRTHSVIPPSLAGGNRGEYGGPRALRTPFAVLISCVLSLRTKDRTTHAASEKLFAVASTPREMLRLTPRKIEKLIYPVGFYRTKARNILRICRILLERWNGHVPDTIEQLLDLPGVGRKTANLVVILGYDKYGICVDTHVHRISNRWGYVRTKTPEQTEMALRAHLPRRHWKVLNDLLVTYGQNLCTPISPWCSRCRISPFCRRVGVTTSR